MQSRIIRPILQPGIRPVVRKNISGEAGVTPYLIYNPDNMDLGTLVTGNGVISIANSQPGIYTQEIVNTEAAPGYTRSLEQDYGSIVACAAGNQNLTARLGFVNGFLSADLPPGTNHIWVKFWVKMPVGWDQGAACGFPEEKFFQIFEDRPLDPKGRWGIATGGGGIRAEIPNDAANLVNLAGNHPDYIPFSAAPNDGYVPWSVFGDGEWHPFAWEIEFGSVNSIYRVFAPNRVNNELVLIHEFTWDTVARGITGFRECIIFSNPMNQPPQAAQIRWGLPVEVYIENPGWL